MRAWGLLVLVGSGCLMPNPLWDMAAGDSGGTGGQLTTAGSGSGTAAPLPGSEDLASDDGATDPDVIDDGGVTSDTGTVTTSAGPGIVECDPYVTGGCPSGEKCNPYDSVGDGIIDSAGCFAILGDGQAGDPCEFLGPYPYSGEDSCNDGLSCGLFMNEANRCMTLCKDGLQLGACDVEQTCYGNELFGYCLQNCNTTDSCELGSCKPLVGIGNVCFSAGPAMLDEGCQPYNCADGLLCVADMLANCPDGSKYCCVNICDADGACTVPDTCQSVYGGSPPPPHADVGVCIP